jgi:hypothetical protein
MEKLTKDNFYEHIDSLIVSFSDFKELQEEAKNLKELHGIVSEYPDFLEDDPNIRITYENSFQCINEGIESLGIKLLEEEKKEPTTRTTYTSKIKSDKKISYLDNFKRNEETTTKENDIGVHKESDSQTVNKQTTQSPYNLTEKDRNIISKLKLSEDKAYIYEEARKILGANITRDLLIDYGTNKFCRELIKKYPSSKKMTTIKGVLEQIINFDSQFN